MTNAEARFNISLRPRKPEGSLGRTAQDGHLDSHTAPELCGSRRYTLEKLYHKWRMCTRVSLNLGKGAGLCAALFVNRKTQFSNCLKVTAGLGMLKRPMCVKLRAQHCPRH